MVLYLAAGIAVSGYFYLYPNYYKTKSNEDNFSRLSLFRHPQYYYREGNEFGVSVLATIVGLVLIGGIGLVMRKPK